MQVNIEACLQKTQMRVGLLSDDQSDKSSQLGLNFDSPSESGNAKPSTKITIRQVDDDSSFQDDVDEKISELNCTQS